MKHTKLKPSTLQPLANDPGSLASGTTVMSKDGWAYLYYILAGASDSDASALAAYINAMAKVLPGLGQRTAFQGVLQKYPPVEYMSSASKRTEWYQKIGGLTSVGGASTTSVSGGSGVSPSVWGPYGWQFIKNVLDHAENVDAVHLEQFLTLMQNVLPCGSCRTNYGQILKKYPPKNYMTTGSGRTRWLQLAYSTTEQHKKTQKWSTLQVPSVATTLPWSMITATQDSLWTKVLFIVFVLAIIAATIGVIVSLRRRRST